MVEIEELNLLGKNEEQSTYTFVPETFNFNEGILAYRKAGTISGRHYHKGKYPGKKPETILLLSGEAKLKCIDKEGVEKEFNLIAPLKIQINAFVWHELTAVSDISFLEFNSLKEHSEDTFRELP